jgi:hypothetical protein
MAEWDIDGAIYLNLFEHFIYPRYFLSVMEGSNPGKITVEQSQQSVTT